MWCNGEEVVSSAIYVPFKPTVPQAEHLQNVLNEEASLHGYIGGVGSGKTQSEVQLALDVSVTLPGNESAIARKYRIDAETTTLREFLATVPSNLVLHMDYKELRMTIRSADPNQPSFINFRGLDEIERWGSTQFGHIFLEEATEIEPRQVSYLFGRIRHKLPLGSDIWKSSPYISLLDDEDFIRFITFYANISDDRFHWINILKREGTLLGSTVPYTLVTADSHSNPNLPKGFFRALKNLPELEYERLVEGKESPGVKGPPVVKNFNKDKHVFNDLWPTYPVYFIRGWDPGWAFEVCLWAEYRQGLIYIWKECISEETSLTTLITDIVQPTEKLCHQDTDYRDNFDHQSLNHHSPQSDKSNFDIMRDHSYFPFSKASKPEKRAELIDDLLKANRILVHKTYCPKLITALRGGWYRDQKTMLIKKDPKSVYHNLGDALGYCTFNEIGATGKKGQAVADDYRKSLEDYQSDPDREYKMKSVFEEQARFAGSGNFYRGGFGGSSL